ncbi:MAG: NADH-quinone oxidoreductase subunit N [Puniceicoccales bacterium]|jgi:NADH-quinone oxidoreductase subunit N|nr:NADH-quinone oxidoreductase subunit N [Puniceicoccales bacterium]
MNTHSDYSFFFAFLPEALLVFGALVVLAADLSLVRGRSHALRTDFAVAVALAATVAAFAAAFFFGEFVSLELFGSRFALLALGVLALLLLAGTSRLKNTAEHVALVLFALTGLMLMSSATNTLVAFLGLELAGLSFYILVGFDKTRRESAEAGLKYFLYGGMASAFLLFGFSLLYGLSNSLDFNKIGATQAIFDTPLGVVALVMVLVGFAYKAAAAPFHHWAPDAYQGAPVTTAALVASASKLAGFMLLARFSSEVFFREDLPVMRWVFVCLVIASLLLGNIAALAQTNVRRLLAYSAIAHAGVLFIAVYTQAHPKSMAHYWLLYYVFTYGLATLGVFGCIAVVENNGGCQKILDLVGLWKRSRLLSSCLLVFVLSLAGVPPLAGFFAKFAVFRETLGVCKPGSEFFWLVLLAIAMSAVALYYYLQILKAVFVADPVKEHGDASGLIKTPLPAAVAIVLAAAAVIVLGLVPC